MTAHTARSANRENVVQWCTKNPEFAVVVGSSGEREIAEATHQFAKRSVGTIFVRSNEGLCMLASLSNAKWALRGAENAPVGGRKLSRLVNIGRSVASLVKDIHALNMRLELYKVKDPEAHILRVDLSYLIESFLFNYFVEMK